MTASPTDSSRYSEHLGDSRPRRAPGPVPGERVAPNHMPGFPDVRERGERAGMTLLEVILAVTLTTGLVAALLGFCSHANGVRRRIIQEVEISSAQRRVMDRITEELQCAVVYRFLSTGLEGSADRMEFVSALLPSPAVWSEASVTEQPRPPEQDLQLVTYSLKLLEDEGGYVRVEGLQRACRKAPAMLEAAEAAEGIDSALMSPYIKFLYLRYWDGAAWVGSWSGGDLPTAVEINLGTEPLPDGVDPQDYPYEEFRRVVYVPGGARAPSGTVILGPGGGGGQ